MTAINRRSRGRGFALVAVLWVMVSVAVLGASLTSSSREAVATAQNRIDLLRAAWRAEACAEGARSVIDDALATDAPNASNASSWPRLDAIVSRSAIVQGCDLSLRPTGTTIDGNTADSARIRAVLIAIGQSVDRADALFDWQDADDTPRPHGAEKAWYSSAHRLTPRDGPIASLDELRLVRGFDQIGGLDTLFGVDNERIDINRAPLAVLTSLPGFDAATVSFIAERRINGVQVGDLSAIAAALAPNSRASLLVHYAELVRLTTTTPEAWTLSSRVAIGQPALVAMLELRLVNAGTRAAVVRRRSWP
jgi:general secretion pathway protein K